MKILIIASSKKPPTFEEELKEGLRYKLEYLYLSDYLNASYMDYDPPWMHENQIIRQIEERIHLDFYWARDIAKLVVEQGYDMVISMSERVAVPLGLLLPKKIKHIAILINTLSRKWLFLIKFMGIYKRWDKIITYSYAEAEALKRILGIESGQITTIHNYVDVEFFNPSIATSFQNTDEGFVFSQGLANRDYPTLIRALWNLPHVICHISAVSAWDKYKAGYEELKIPDNVRIVSYDHPHIIRDVLAKCQFLVIPLKPEAGMLCSGSTSVLQAQAMGKPVVVTNLSGTSEYIQDNITGFLVDGKDTNLLAEKIELLWSNSNEAKRMGQNGLMWVNENFSLNNWIKKMTEVINNLP